MRVSLSGRGLFLHDTVNTVYIRTIIINIGKYFANLAMMYMNKMEKKPRIISMHLQWRNPFGLGSCGRRELVFKYRNELFVNYWVYYTSFVYRLRFFIKW